MTPVGFEPTIAAGERPKTYALDRAANGTGHIVYGYTPKFIYKARYSVLVYKNFTLEQAMKARGGSMSIDLPFLTGVLISP